MKLEFDKTYFIRDIRVYHKFYTGWYDPDDWCIESEDNFRKCVDKQSDVDVSIYQGEVKSKSCGTLQFQRGLEQSDQVYTLACNTAGDTVKFSKAIETLNLFEVVTKGTGNYLKMDIRLYLMHITYSVRLINLLGSGHF